MDFVIKAIFEYKKKKKKKNKNKYIQIIASKYGGKKH